MFGKQLRLKRFLGGIVVTAAVAVVAVPSALSSTSARGGTAAAAPDVLARYVANHTGEMQRGQGYRFTTDTLGGARHLVAAQQLQPNRFTSDTIASNDGLPIPVNAFNPNGYEPATVVGAGRTAAPVDTGSSSSTGTGPNWRDVGIGAGFVAALLLLLLASTQIRKGRRGGVSTA